MNIEEFDSIELTSEYQHLGETLKQGILRELMEHIEKIPSLLYTCSTVNSAITNDIYGQFLIQRIGHEDRLLFRNNHAHVHIQWSMIKTAKLTQILGYPGENKKHWVGIQFFNQQDIELFSIWNTSADMPFNDQIISCLKKLNLKQTDLGLK